VPINRVLGKLDTSCIVQARIKAYPRGRYRENLLNVAPVEPSSNIREHVFLDESEHLRERLIGAKVPQWATKRRPIIDTNKIGYRYGHDVSRHAQAAIRFQVQLERQERGFSSQLPAGDTCRRISVLTGR